LRSAVLNKTSFADYKVVFSESEYDLYDLQTSTHQLQIITNSQNLKILKRKTNVIAFEGKYPLRPKVIIKYKLREQTQNVYYLGSDMSYSYGKELEQKLSIFQHMCRKIQRTLKTKTRKFYKIVAAHMVMYGRENRKTGLSVDPKEGKLNQQKTCF
jgi:hypothetical protein